MSSKKTTETDCQAVTFWASSSLMSPLYYFYYYYYYYYCNIKSIIITIFINIYNIIYNIIYQVDIDRLPFISEVYQCKYSISNK